MKPLWFWFFLKKDLLSLRSRSAVRWMNLFAFFSVLTGVFAWILVMAFMEGLQSQSREQMLAENPHLLWEGSVRNDLLKNEGLLSEALKSKIKKMEFVFQSEALLEKNAEEGSQLVREGVILQSSDDVPHGKAYVGKELSDVAQILRGDEISLLSVWRLEGMPLKVEAAEFFESGVYEVDKLLVKVNRRDLEQWLGLSSAVTRIAIQLKNPQEADLLQAALTQAIGVPLKTWKQVDQSYWYSLQLEKFAMGISMFFVIALASLSVNMAVSARVVEKSREISLLRSMGMTARRIFIVYLSQGAVIGLTSSVLAALIAYPVGEWVSHSYKLPPIFYVNDLPVSWNFPSIIALCLLSTLLSVWASWKPARRAMKTSISAGLRI